MYYQQDLRVKLQHRRNRLYKAAYQVYEEELKYFMQFLRSVPYLVGILEELECMHPDITFEEWQSTGLGWGQLSFPDSETKKAKVCYGCVIHCIEGKAQPWQIAINLNRGSGQGLDARVRTFTEVFVDPLVDFLHERVDEGSSMLYLLEQYKHKVEWFRREALLAQYQADTIHGEANLDAHLREFLVDQGIEYPFSTPLSPSGRTDILAGLHTPDPLVLEVKLFDPDKGYGKTYVRQGLTQVYKYAADYNKTVGYLVVYNLSDHDLVFQTTQDDKRWPPRVQVGNSTFFIIPIDVHPVERTASQQKKLRRCEISEAYLLGGDEDDSVIAQPTQE